VTALPTRGLPLGVLPGTSYRHESATLGTPATLLLHTDGLTDTRNTAGRRFGQRRLQAWLQEHTRAGHSATELRDRLAAELNRFRGDALMADDQAFLVMTEEDLAAVNLDEAEMSRPHHQHGSLLLQATA
jgi:sigma-B regulation protein RsbU (phosphoserine phosphatase)